MSKKRRERGEKDIDITSFFQPRPKEEEKEKRVAKDKIGEKELEEVIEEIYKYISISTGGVTKSRLYQWAKSRGISQAMLYNSLQKLISSGRVKRVFDDSREEYAYIPVS